jgi:hypothetical protein
MNSNARLVFPSLDSLSPPLNLGDQQSPTLVNGQCPCSPKRQRKDISCSRASGTCIMDLPPEFSESLSLSLEKENVQPEVTRWPDRVMFGYSMSCSFSFPSFLFFFFSFSSFLFPPSIVRGNLGGLFHALEIVIWKSGPELMNRCGTKDPHNACCFYTDTFALLHH